MSESGLGRLYRDGEIVIREGDVAYEMYVVQEGAVEVLAEHGGNQRLLRTAGKGELFGEMAIFDRDVRSATVRAKGEVRILTVDKRTLLRRINEDPSLAFQLIRNLSRRVKDLSQELARLPRAGGDQ